MFGFFSRWRRSSKTPPQTSVAPATPSIPPIETASASEPPTGTAATHEAALSGDQRDVAELPEMEEMPSSFYVRRPPTALDKRESIMERPMEADANLEIPSVNPEDYYQKTL